MKLKAAAGCRTIRRVALVRDDGTGREGCLPSRSGMTRFGVFIRDGSAALPRLASGSLLDGEHRSHLRGNRRRPRDRLFTKSRITAMDDRGHDNEIYFLALRQLLSNHSLKRRPSIPRKPLVLAAVNSDRRGGFQDRSSIREPSPPSNAIRFEFGCRS